MLKSRKIDGLIVSSSQADASFFNKLADENYPHVLIDRIFTEMRSPNVSVDNFGGARMAARHLLPKECGIFVLLA
jgi:DNA-binding LacI/PurR family transcriptional regulator